MSSLALRKDRATSLPQYERHIFKQPHQGGLTACFTPAGIYLERLLISLSIARFLLPKRNQIEKSTSTSPILSKQIGWPWRE